MNAGILVLHSLPAELNKEAKEYWSSLFPTDFSNPRIQPGYTCVAGGFFPSEPPRQLEMRLINYWVNRSNLQY